MSKGHLHRGGPALGLRLGGGGDSQQETRAVWESPRWAVTSHAPRTFFRFEVGMHDSELVEGAADCSLFCDVGFSFAMRCHEKKERKPGTANIPGA